MGPREGLAENLTGLHLLLARIFLHSFSHFQVRVHVRLVCLLLVRKPSRVKKIVLGVQQIKIQWPTGLPGKGWHELGGLCENSTIREQFTTHGNIPHPPPSHPPHANKKGKPEKATVAHNQDVDHCDFPSYPPPPPLTQRVV